MGSVSWQEADALGALQPAGDPHPQDGWWNLQEQASWGRFLPSQLLRR